MSLSAREKQRLQELRKWEAQYFVYEPTDFTITIHKWLEDTVKQLPQAVREKLFTGIDTWLFHLHALLQGSTPQMQARERLIKHARTFEPKIDSIEDLRSLSIDQLAFLADMEISKHRLYSFGQGALSGTGNLLLTGVDLPMMVLINLRIVQLIALTYGYDVNRPFEMMTSLKVYHAAVLPKRMRKVAWERLFLDLENHQDYFFYEGNEELTDESWIQEPLKQLLKQGFILFNRNKLFQGIPLLTMSMAAGMNYSLTRQVTEFAHHYYQLRYLLEKGGNPL